MVEVSPRVFGKIVEQADYVVDSDPVNHPSHYTDTKYEAWDVLDEFFPDDPLKWNAGKYLLRAGKKGDEVQDLLKAIQYLQRRVERVRNGSRDS